MSRSIGILVLSCGLAIGFAQTQAPNRDQDRPRQPKAELNDPASDQQTGCLSKDKDSFELSDAAGGSVALTGPADLLAKHEGHTVMVIGKRVKTFDGREVLRVDSITHVAASCPDAKGPSAVEKSDSEPEKNSRDALTADDQGDSEADQEITQKIRAAVVDDEKLSMDAHNAKIITLNGKVTLRGTVRTEAEKEAIESKARAVVGDGRVDNELVVRPGDSEVNPHPK